MPGGLREGPVVSHDFEKAQEGVQDEEYVIHELEALHRRVVLGEDQAIGGLKVAKQIHQRGRHQTVDGENVHDELPDLRDVLLLVD